MLKLILRISQFVIFLIKKLSGAHFTSSGEAIPEAPVLFLANHFTRFETVIVPYVLFSDYRRISRSLADDTFFAGWLGEYLRLIGTVSDKSKEKDCIILDSMLSGKADWIIYPEGNMVKNKQIIFKQGAFHIQTGNYKGHVHTGAAVLALKSEIMRERIKQTHDEAAILRFCKAHRMDRSKAEEHVHLHIVPLSITYYPIRPGESRLLLFIDRWLNLRGTRFFEELEIEINLLMKANMHLHFGKPISVKSYLDAYLAEHGGSIEDDALADRLISTQRKVLTTDIMREVYGNLQINFDHLFILSLFTMPVLKVSPDHLRKLIYKNARELRDDKELNLHPELQTRLFHLILDRNYAPFRSAIKLARAQKILFEDSDGDYLFDKSLLETAYDFHKIRVKDTLQVILNEIRWQEKIVSEAKANATLSEQALRIDNFEYLKAVDRDHYEKEFLAYNPAPPPPDSVGASRIFFDPKNSAGLVFSHGYLSVPAALEAMGRYLFARGINVYLPRLSGHGTDPEALKKVTAEAWESDFERAFTAMRQACDKVFIGGFSTGGLLALLHAAAHDADGVIVVNTALKLNDLKVNYVVETLNVFNEMIEYLHARGIKEWIENDSEVSDMNYPKHPLSSVAEVESMMNKTRKALPRVKAPLLIIQGDRDPTVNPKSADLIYHGVSSADKELMLIPRTEHNILSGGEADQVDLFEDIFDYITRLLAKQEG